MTSVGPIARAVVLGGNPTRAEIPRSRSVEASNTTNVPALTSISPPIRSTAYHGRPDPSFIAHLIATADGAPQTRTLRRATAQETLRRYVAATERVNGNTFAGQNFSRLL